jgi:hypothetical protein
MNGDRFDDLDEALFALELEQPPADLRASILRATIHDPAAAPAPVFAPSAAAAARYSNPIPIGVAAAIAVWLCLAIFVDRGFASEIAEAIVGFGRLLGEPSTLVWLALGAAAAAAVQIADALPRRIAVRGNRP